MYELNPNTTLQSGKYRIQKVLGQGTFGITYLASMQVNGSGCDMEVDVAIKEFFMKEQNTRSDENSSVTGSQSELFRQYREKFKTEAKNLAKMSDFDDIQTIYDVFEENNTAYFAMEYIDGINLNEYIKQNGRLSESEAVDISRSIAKALKHLHNNNMLHLDLKPKNVMRRNDGKIYLIDFGLSKQYDEKGEPESSSTIGLGTPGYAPLEQANFKGGFAPTLDIYALGATLYKMLTGETPPESSDIFNDGFESLLQKMRSFSISEKTIAVVEKAMQVRKSNRYQSVDEFLAALERFKKNNEDDGTQISVAPKTKKYKALKIALAVVAVIILIIVIFRITRKNAAENAYPLYKSVCSQIEQIALDLTYSSKSDEILISEVDEAKRLLQDIHKMEDDYAFVWPYYNQYFKLCRRLNDGIVNFESKHSPIIVKNLKCNFSNDTLHFQADIISFQDERIEIFDYLFGFSRNSEWIELKSTLRNCTNSNFHQDFYCKDIETVNGLLRYRIAYSGKTYEIGANHDRRISSNKRIIADTTIVIQ